MFRLHVINLYTIVWAFLSIGNYNVNATVFANANISICLPKIDWKVSDNVTEILNDFLNPATITIIRQHFLPSFDYDVSNCSISQFRIAEQDCLVIFRVSK